MAERMPSIMPMPTSCCIDSTEAEVVTVVQRDPFSVGAKVKAMCIVGISVLGRPNSSAKPSCTSKRAFGSMARKRNQPRDVVPSGPVMW